MFSQLFLKIVRTTYVFLDSALEMNLVQCIAGGCHPEQVLFCVCVLILFCSVTLWSPNGNEYVASVPTMTPKPLRLHTAVSQRQLREPEPGPWS